MKIGYRHHLLSISIILGLLFAILCQGCDSSPKGIQSVDPASGNTSSSGNESQSHNTGITETSVPQPPAVPQAPHASGGISSVPSSETNAPTPGVTTSETPPATIPAPQTATLNVSVTGAGNGTVASSTGGINCKKSEGICTATLTQGTPVTLTASADPGYYFVGWIGSGCHGLGSCTITQEGIKSVTAVFRMLLFYSGRSLSGSDATNGPSSINNIWVVKTDGSGIMPLTHLTASGIAAMNGVWSPDGTKVVFSSAQALDQTDTANTLNTYNLWVMNADGSGLTPLTTSQNSASKNFIPAWSPDGTKIVFYASYALDGTDAANVNNTQNIWIVNKDGTGLRPLTRLTASHSDCILPQWSPDETKIVFSCRRALDGSDAANVNNTQNIWVMNADGTGVLSLTRLTAINTFAQTASFSPNGNKIVYQSSRVLDGTDQALSARTSNIWVMNVDGTGSMPLTNQTEIDCSSTVPNWSPDGSKVAYHSDRALDGSNSPNLNLTFNIWVTNVDGTGSVPLTNLTGADASSYIAIWSPDASKIVFFSSRALDGSNKSNTNGTRNVWTVNADGTGATPITNLTNVGASGASRTLF